MEPMNFVVLSDVPNSTIVRVPGRKYPGVVIQGDTLKSIYDLVEEIAGRVGSSKPEEQEELRGVLVELETIIRAHLENYEKVLYKHGIDLPYGRSIMKSA